MEKSRVGNDIKTDVVATRGLPCLSFREKPFILRMSADPEPENLIRRSPYAHGAVITADADGD
jgi:hypothetical protein